MANNMIVGMTYSDVLPGRRVVRTYAHNVPDADVAEVKAQATAQGWTALSAHPEAF